MEEMAIPSVANVIAEIGAPWTLCLALLYLARTSIRELTNAINKQTKALETIPNIEQKIDKLIDEIKELRYKIGADANANAKNH